MERINNKLNPHIALTPGFEAGQHERWWDTSALTTAPPLLPGYYPVLRSFEKWITQKNSKNSNFILNLHHRGLNRPFLETEIRLLSLHLKEKNSSFTTFLMICLAATSWLALMMYVGDRCGRSQDDSRQIATRRKCILYSTWGVRKWSWSANCRKKGLELVV